MRIDAQQYYALAASAADIPLKVSALARERIGGLQGITAEVPKPRVTILGHRWDCDSGPRLSPNIFVFGRLCLELWTTHDAWRI
jgi:hypothetical protein